MFSKHLAEPFKKIWSYIYRIFLLVLCGEVFFRRYTDLSERLFIVFCLLLWFIIFILIKKYRKNSLLRVAFDFTLIGLTVFLAEQKIEFKIMLVLIPMLNQQNYSEGNKKFKVTVMYFLMWSILFWATFQNFCLFSLSLYFFIFALLLMDFLNCKINSISDALEILTYEMLDKVDEKVGVSAGLKSVKKFLNTKLWNTLSVDDIFLIEFFEHKYLIRSGTRFHPRLFFKLKDEFSLEKSKTYLFKLDSNYDEIFKIKDCVGALIKKENRNFIYVLVLSNPLKSLSLKSLVAYQVLRKPMQNLTRLLINRIQIKQAQRAINDELIKNSQYISSVRAAAHFLKNNINPFTTVHEMLSEYLDPDVEACTVTEDDLRAVNQKLESTQSRILLYITKILEAPRQGIFVEDFQIYNAEKIVKEIQLCIEQNSSNVKVKYKFETNDLEKLKYKIKFMNFSVLIENLVKNLTKYSKSSQEIECHFNYDSAIIKFSNELKKSEQAKAMQYVNDINSSTKEEILKRQGEGLLLIKQAAENLESKLEASIFEGQSITITFTLGAGNV
jgi:hypothetical protein